MAVFAEEVDIGDVAAVSTVDVAGSLEKHSEEESLYRAACGLREGLNSRPRDHNSVPQGSAFVYASKVGKTQEGHSNKSLGQERAHDRPEIQYWQCQRAAPGTNQP